jgi:hypothetical protein
MINQFGDDLGGWLASNLAFLAVTGKSCRATAIKYLIPVLGGIMIDIHLGVSGFDA